MKILILKKYYMKTEGDKFWGSNFKYPDNITSLYLAKQLTDSHTLTHLA